MRLTILTLFLILVVFLISLQQSTAQSADINELNNALGFESTVNDVPESPIHLLVWLGLILGGFLGMKKLKSN